MTDFVRGSKLFFTATFVDASGNPATPSAATLYLVYTNLLRVRQSTSVSMSLAGNVGTASWDSSVASDGPLVWSVKGTGSNAIVQDGVVTLTANEANPTS